MKLNYKHKELTMLKLIKNRLSRNKDHAGRNINKVIENLATQSGTSIYAWSYLKDELMYENTATGARIYAYEVPKRAA